MSLVRDPSVNAQGENRYHVTNTGFHIHITYEEMIMYQNIIIKIKNSMQKSKK